MISTRKWNGTGNILSIRDKNPQGSYSSCKHKGRICPLKREGVAFLYILLVTYHNPWFDSPKQAAFIILADIWKLLRVLSAPLLKMLPWHYDGTIPPILSFFIIAFPFDACFCLAAFLFGFIFFVFTALSPADAATDLTVLRLFAQLPVLTWAMWPSPGY